MCGVFGICAPDRDVARLTHFGLHRAPAPRPGVGRDRGLGQRPPDRPARPRPRHPGLRRAEPAAACAAQIAIGHTRYSTTGSTQWANAQPIVQHGRRAHGRARPQRQPRQHVRAARRAATRRRPLGSTSDTEVIAALIANDPQPLADAVASAMRRLEGAYSVTALAEGKLLAFRDPHGFRPLVLGRLARRLGGRLGDLRARPRRRRLRARGRARRARLIVDESGVARRCRPSTARPRRALHLRVLLPRAPRLPARGRRGARRARPDGRAARRRGAGRGRPRPADPRLGHAGGDRLLARDRDPVQRGADQEPLRRPHVHPARPGAPRAGHPPQVQPARARSPASASSSSTTRSSAATRRARSSRCSSTPARPRCTSASRRRR